MSSNCQKNSQAFVDSSVKVLKSGGVRVTKTRLAVLQVLSELDKPHSARELFEAVAGCDKIDQVTVYRILEKFEKMELVHRVFPSGSYFPCFHQDCGPSPHILIRCSACEDISELNVPKETLAPMIWYLKKEQGFSPNPHLFQVDGVCSSCEKK